MNSTPNSARPGLSRRDFLQTTSKAAAGGVALAALSAERFAHAAGSDELKLALVGCGGRGTGAVNQNLNVGKGARLVAMADISRDRLDKSLQILKTQHPDQVDVSMANQFIGFDAYKHAIALADLVFVTTPQGFHPYHLAEAVRQGKHVFVEKPLAVDAPGVRRILAAAEEAKKKNLKVAVGLQRHHQAGYIETIKRLQDGAIGDIVSMRAYWNGQRPWQKKRADLEKMYGRKLTEMEYQLRNWYYFTWICGDHICEQHIHNIDVINWLKKGHPVKARAMGGREINHGGSDDGEIFDHFAVQYEYEDGSISFSEARHQPGCWNSVSEHCVGTKGHADISKFQIFANDPWRYKAEGAKDPYQQEHDDLFTAIRNNKEYNEAPYGATSTMTAILGRMAAYSGKEIEWDKALASKIELLPEKFAFDAPTKVNPGPDGNYPRAIPGQTEVL